MSPRGSVSSISSSSSKSSSFSSRRPSGQPKSSRQQFSACGACRMRRVRCDLKDLSMAAAGPSPSCSNCRERGLKCVDEFAEVKAVKLLRRGRRLQQVEAIYGKISEQDSSITLTSFSRLPSIIPKLHPEFFHSQFWRWFCIQRPILDADEFAARFRAHDAGSAPFSPDGEILVRIISVWAVSFGLDDHGLATSEDIFEMSEKQKRDQKDRVLAMVREVLELIDHQSIMRRPSWDGLRLLLLVLPFMDEYPAIEKLAVYNATLSQAHTLCTLVSSCSPMQREDSVTRARLFWYTHLFEGFSTALRGGRLVLSDEDFEAFQSTLPSDAAGLHPTMSAVTRLFSGPLQLNNICRRIHAVLGSPAAKARAEQTRSLDYVGLQEIWENLDHCWEEFDLLRNNTTDPQHVQDVERYIAAAQIFIFECHNIIRETLKELVSVQSSSSSSSSAPSSPSVSGSSIDQYHQLALRKCFRLLPAVVEIMKSHTALSDGPLGGSGLFKWDTNLVRDGCFFAGVLAANYDECVHKKFLIEEGSVKEEEGNIAMHLQFSGDDGVATTLAALREMRWIMSCSDERLNTIHIMYEQRHRRRFPPCSDSAAQARTIEMHYGQQPAIYSSSAVHQQQFQVAPKVVLHPAAGERPLLPPLILESPRRVHSAPSTALSTSTDSSWPTYTPPGTGNSSVGTQSSPFPSPQAGYKSESVMDDSAYYPIQNDMSQFTFNPPMSSLPSPLIVSDSLTAAVNGYHSQHRSPSHCPPMHVSPTTQSYIDTGVPFSANSTLINHSPPDEARGCPPFAEEHCGYY